MFEFEVQTNYGYGHGWEVTVTESTKAEAEARLAEYRANQPEYPHRVRRVRVTEETA